MYFCQVHTGLRELPPEPQETSGSSWTHSARDFLATEDSRVPGDCRKLYKAHLKSVLAQLEAGPGLWGPIWAPPVCPWGSQVPVTHHSQLRQQPHLQNNRSPKFLVSPFIPGPLQPNVACEQQAWLLLG